MHRAIFLLFAALMLLLAANVAAIIDYAQLPACAASCKIIGTAESICVPPAAPVSNKETYIDCFCQSAYLKTLHADGEICHVICAHEDDVMISRYYNEFCGVPVPASSSSTTTLPALTPIASSEAIEPSEAAPAPPKESEAKPRDHGAWLQDNWKYLVVAGVLIVFALVILFGLAFLHRNQKKKGAGEANPHHGMIPLHQMPATGPSRPTTSGEEEDLNNLPSPAVSSPLGSPSSPHSFQNHLIFYKEAQREIEERQARGRLPIFELPRNS
ncbi:hypothetical protein FB567DRAFT_149260 [Paraphoma chrysanthemicola]|uniref:Integral membrane protein n=1 Tax=Paraphoma chrysanthemicola TaxID=798071 RepID=A0A8K0QYX2_9PLEO|nr:hypothetical protein FB567DRAFT_149260 [Paraphoma chrysanthemicola]